MKQKILDASRGGLDIILSYYPQAEEVLSGRQKHFKIRDEKTGSASLKEYNGVWKVTDFGDDQKARNCFDVCMMEENITFAQCIALLAERYNVDYKYKPDINKPDVQFRATKEGESVGKYTYKTKKAPSACDMEALSSWMKPTDVIDLMQKYNVYALEYYTYTFERKDSGVPQTKEIRSTDNFPIFLFDYGNFHKIVCPYAYEKSDRFRYINGRDERYICGLPQIKDAFAQMNVQNKMEAEQYALPYKEEKLPAIILCSGERDAFNCAGMGYFPVWLNSETAQFGQREIQMLSKYAEKVVNIPDSDETGVRMAMKKSLACWEMYTALLPDWLKNYRDRRGKPCKDLQDWCHLRQGNRQELRAIVDNAKRCQFWEEYMSNNKRKYEINTINLLWYLRCNGFYKIEDSVSGQDVLVRFDNYKVQRMTAKQIRGFIKKELDRLNVPIVIQRLFQDSKKCGSALMEDLPAVEIDFTKSTLDSRTFYFNNKAIRVKANSVESISNSEIKSRTWEKNVSPHNFTRLEPMITFDDELCYHWNRNIQSNYMRVMINSSRVYWREELEERVTGDVQQDEQYAQEHKFDLCGSRLSEQEQMEQMQFFFSKCYALGYMLHQYKTPSNAKAVWILENRLTDANESAGGSGKSFFVESLAKYYKLLNIATLSGREKGLTENKHVLDRIDKWTDILYVDDASANFDFDFFYSMITGNTIVNPKGEKTFEIDFHDSPIPVFSSNYPPQRGKDRSTLRRLLLVVYSDYYHEKGSDDLYRETRKISDDIGYDIGEEGYSERDFNADINFLVDCTQFYLRCRELHYQPMPPMENIYKRFNIAEMGNSGFEDWAEAYFSEESGNTDCLIRRDMAFDDFKRSTDNRQWTPYKFNKALKAYVENSERILCVNPKELQANDKRIIRRINNKAYECLYLQTKTEINNILKRDLW